MRDGLACAFVRYAAEYVPIEREARRAGRGVFAAENTSPWEFREQRWNVARDTAETDAARRCPIKGNVSRDGTRIYHLPWQRDDGRVRIDERRGERWFCDEGEAKRAGWRRTAR